MSWALHTSLKFHLALQNYKQRHKDQVFPFTQVCQIATLRGNKCKCMKTTLQVTAGMLLGSAEVPKHLNKTQNTIELPSLMLEPVWKNAPQNETYRQIPPFTLFCIKNRSFSPLKSPNYQVRQEVHWETHNLVHRPHGRWGGNHELTRNTWKWPGCILKKVITSLSTVSYSTPNSHRSFHHHISKHSTKH